MAKRKTASVIKTVTATNSPEQLTATATRVASVSFTGLKAARTENVGDVWVQHGSGDDTAAMKVRPGAIITFTTTSEVDDYYELSDFYVDVEVAGDGVVALYDEKA